MVLFTSLGVKLKIWLWPTSEKCGRNSVGSHFEFGHRRNRQSGKIVIYSLMCDTSINLVIIWVKEFTYDNFKPK